MTLKRCLTDIRNPTRWTKADRARGCERAVVSSRWGINPLGFDATEEVMPMVQPGILYWDGKPADENGYNGRLAELVTAIPDWDEIAGDTLSIWGSNDGRQELLAFDVSNVAIVERWAETLLVSFPWASGIHLDYFTNLAWLAPDRPVWAWKGWDAGYALLCETLRQRQPMWNLIGQQYHLTPLSPFADGQYVEESPGHFGQSFADHDAMLASVPHPTNWCYELRYPERAPVSYQKQVIDLVARHECFLSWDRDATAGVGLAEAVAGT